MENNKKLKRAAEALIPSDWGKFKMIAFAYEDNSYSPDIAMVHPDMKAEQIITVRIHSECITGDLFHSQRCDCGRQLDLAMQRIEADKGVLIYLRQEGRGIGLINKLKAYNKQDEGLDTVEANLALGLDIDYRRYENAISILKEIGISRIRLLTNNPDKVLAFENSGIEVVERLALEVEANENNKKYLETKKHSLGHFLKLNK